MILSKQPKRAAAFPSPGGLPELGKRGKEFVAAKALGAERVGTSESLGQGEGGFPHIQFFGAFAAQAHWQWCHSNAPAPPFFPA